MTFKVKVTNRDKLTDEQKVFFGYSFNEDEWEDEFLVRETHDLNELLDWIDKAGGRVVIDNDSGVEGTYSFEIYNGWRE